MTCEKKVILLGWLLNDNILIIMTIELRNKTNINANIWHPANDRIGSCVHGTTVAAVHTYTALGARAIEWI